MYDRIESIQFSNLPDPPPPDDFDDEDDVYEPDYDEDDFDDEDEDGDEPSDSIEDLRDEMASAGLTTWGQGSRLSVALYIHDAYRHPIRVEVGIPADYINDRGEVLNRGDLVTKIREDLRGCEDTPEVAAIRTALLISNYMQGPRLDPEDLTITVEIMDDWAAGYPTRFVFNQP